MKSLLAALLLLLATASTSFAGTITNLTLTAKTDTSVTFTFSTDVDGSSVGDLFQSNCSSVLGRFDMLVPDTQSHTVTITGLTASTAYCFKPVSSDGVDYMGCSGVCQWGFTTNAAPTPTATPTATPTVTPTRTSTPFITQQVSQSYSILTSGGGYNNQVSAYQLVEGALGAYFYKDSAGPNSAIFMPQYASGDFDEITTVGTVNYGWAKRDNNFGLYIRPNSQPNSASFTVKVLYTASSYRYPTETSTATPSPVDTASPTDTATKTATRTITATFTASATRTVSPTRTRTPNFTATVTVTPSISRTRTPTFTRTMTRTVTPTPTFTATGTVTPTFTVTPSVTPTVTP